MAAEIKEKPILYIVIPCYNEEEVIEETVRRLTEKIDSMIAAGQVAKNSRFLLRGGPLGPAPFCACF